jgi:hypothetical protein
MRISQAEYHAFMAEKGKMYPYNHVRQTRNGIYPKWIIVKSREPHSLFRRNGFHLLPSACLSNEVIKQVVVTEQGVPLPTEYDNVAHTMEYWGAIVNGIWYQEVLSMMYSFLSEGEELDEQYLYYDVVYLLFKMKVDALLLPYDVLCAATDAFESNFNRWYKSVTKDFWQLVTMTIQYADNLISLNHSVERTNNLADFVRGSEANPVVLE